MDRYVCEDDLKAQGVNIEAAEKRDALTFWRCDAENRRWFQRGAMPLVIHGTPHPNPADAAKKRAERIDAVDEFADADDEAFIPESELTKDQIRSGLMDGSLKFWVKDAGGENWFERVEACDDFDDDDDEDFDDVD